MRKVIILTGILLSFLCSTNLPNEDELRENVINTAAKLLGTPYRSGGSNDNGFDCSGFVRHVMESNNIKVSRSSVEQIEDGFGIPLEAAKPGDILIFKGANKNAKRAGHAAIVHHIDKSGVVHFIHSASSKGITIDNLNMDYYKARFMEARDIINWAFTKN